MYYWACLSGGLDKSGWRDLASSGSYLSSVISLHRPPKPFLLLRSSVYVPRHTSPRHVAIYSYTAKPWRLAFCESVSENTRSSGTCGAMLRSTARSLHFIHIHTYIFSFFFFLTPSAPFLSLSHAFLSLFLFSLFFHRSLCCFGQVSVVEFRGLPVSSRAEKGVELGETARERRIPRDC